MVISDDHAQKPHLKRPMLSDSDVISTTISCAGSYMDLVSPCGYMVLYHPYQL